MAEKDLIKLASENVEAYSTGNWQRLKEVLAPDVVYDEVGSQRRMQGADQLVQAYQGWKKAAPNGKGKIKNTFVSGRSVALEVIWTGPPPNSVAGSHVPLGE